MSDEIATCTGCDFEAELPDWGPIEFRYRLKTGDEIPCPRTTGWCDTCNGLTFIEQLAPSEFMHGPEEIDKLHQMIRNRRSKARCLNCYSIETLPVTFSSEDNVANDFTHSCGGKLKSHCVESEFHFSMTPMLRILNSEGYLLTESEVE
jgi:hypothetical protein